MDWGITLGTTYFNSLDIIIFCLTLIGGISGAFEGFAKSFASKADFFVGTIVGLMFTKPAAAFLQGYFPDLGIFTNFIAFIITFFIGYLLIVYLGEVLTKVFDNLGLGALNSLLGFFFGGAVTFIICCAIIYLFSFQHLIDFSDITSKSWIYLEVINPFVPELYKKVVK